MSVRHDVDRVKKQFNQFVEAVSEEKLARSILREAVKPIEVQIKLNLQPHRVTGLTEEDVRTFDMPTEPGPTVRVAVGASGNKRGRGFILRFLELGTSHNRAFPVVRPAIDEHGPAVLSRVTEMYRKVLDSISWAQGVWKKSS